MRPGVIPLSRRRRKPILSGLPAEIQIRVRMPPVVAGILAKKGCAAAGLGVCWGVELAGCRAGEGQHGRPATRGTKMKIRNGKFSGTFDNAVHLDSKHGHVVRIKSRRPWRATVGRLAVQRTPGIVGAAWRQLTKPQYQRWVAAFQEFKRRLPKGIPCPKDVCHFFGKINGTLVSHGQLVELLFRGAFR